MFNKDGLFGRRDENMRNDARTGANATPDLTPGYAPQRQPSAPSPRFDSPAEPPRAAPAKEEPAGSKLIVGPDIKLKGVEITDCDTLVVEGRVEASMHSRVVQIARDGVFTGTATMDVAEIWGTFHGQLTVREQLVVYATGRVSGEIRYGRIRIEEGGELSGNVRTLDAPTAAKASAASAPASASRAPTGAAASR